MPRRRGRDLSALWRALTLLIPLLLALAAPAVAQQKPHVLHCGAPDGALSDVIGRNIRGGCRIADRVALGAEGFMDSGRRSPGLPTRFALPIASYGRWQYRLRWATKWFADGVAARAARQSRSASTSTISTSRGKATPPGRPDPISKRTGRDLSPLPSRHAEPSLGPRPYSRLLPFQSGSTLRCVEIPPEYEPHPDQIPPWVDDVDRFLFCFAIGRAICQRDDPKFVRELYAGDIPSTPWTATISLTASGLAERCCPPTRRQATGQSQDSPAARSPAASEVARPAPGQG